MANTKRNIKTEIQVRYGAVADQAGASDLPLPLDRDGCAPQTKAAATLTNLSLAERLYSHEELADLPDSVTKLSLGCGNPVALANLRPGETVLDLGCGGGIDCFLAARAVGPSGRVIGVDVTAAMLARANENKAKLALSNVDFREGQIERLPVESESVDSIISNCVIDISQDKAAVFAEAFRVLKPGGRMSVTDTVLDGEFPDAVRANVDRWAGAVITPLITLKEYLRFIHQAGFAEVGVESLTSYGLENLEALDDASRQMLNQGVDWSTVPANAGLYSARIIARKPS